MDKQEYEGGFKVRISQCEHANFLEIASFAGAKITAGSNGMVALECTDVSRLLTTLIPTKTTMSALAATFSGFGGNMAGFGHDDHQHDQRVLLFPDELSLEMWLSTEFIPGLDLFTDEDGVLVEDLTDQTSTMTKKIMVEVMSARASAEVRRNYWS